MVRRLVRRLRAAQPFSSIKARSKLVSRIEFEYLFRHLIINPPIIFFSLKTIRREIILLKFVVEKSHVERFKMGLSQFSQNLVRKRIIPNWNTPI